MTFGSVAAKLGLALYWRDGGSKMTRLNVLLSDTFQFRHGLFTALVVEIVKEGLVYREKSGSPITRGEVEAANGFLLKLSSSSPELADPAFLGSLAGPIPIKEDSGKEKGAEIIRELEGIRTSLHDLYTEPDRSKAGLAVEGLLNRLFLAFGLRPRQPFRVVGEQIDGSFELDNEIYLIEAKWQREKTAENDLLVFKGKIEGKSAFTRGVFISINGFSTQAMEAIRHGKQPTFFAMNGYDIDRILSEDVNFRDYLRQRYRTLAEEGQIFVPFREAFPTV